MGDKMIISKNSVWDRSMRVQLVIAGAGVAQNRECPHPVSLIDLYPTCVDYAKLPANPNGDPRKLDGHSLRPFLENPETENWSGKDFALSCASSSVPLGADRIGRAADQHWSLRTEQFRYVRGQDGTELLYDYRSDPHEWKNLAGSPKHQSLINKLRADLNVALEGAQ